jgi:hypothetical protein
MSATYTNKAGLTLPMAVWLFNDQYDYDNDPNSFSATEMLKPMREIILSRRNTDSNRTLELADFAQSRDGSAMHDSIEEAWKNPRALHKACKLLGISEDIYSSIAINPKPDELVRAKEIGLHVTPVYLEQRAYKELDGFKISGKFDLVMAGDLHDYKKTGTFTYIHQTGAEKFPQQGSIYRWLIPEIILSDTLTINYYFSDWVKWKTSNPMYPQSRILSQHFEMMPIEQTELFLKRILADYVKYKDRDQKDLPQCTDKELWKGETQYKYFSNPNNARATKNFGNRIGEANAYIASKGGKGIIKPFPGEIKACKYCSVLPHCDQAANYIKTKQLDLS